MINCGIIEKKRETITHNGMVHPLPLPVDAGWHRLLHTLVDVHVAPLLPCKVAISHGDGLEAADVGILSGRGIQRCLVQRINNFGKFNDLV